MSIFWIVEKTLDTLAAMDRFILQPNGIGLRNDIELTRSLTELRATLPANYRADARLPDGFPRPALDMPPAGFAPDFFHHRFPVYASRRLRHALAQPEDIVQYWPIDLMTGGPEVVAQDYRWVRFLAARPAVDLERSKYVVEEGVQKSTGETFRYVHFYDQMVLRDDLGPTPDIYRVAEDLITILVTDALAERIQRAGCTGIDFLDPATRGYTAYMRRYRTLTGVREEWTGRRADP
jgi:hypothetical protein